MELIQNWENRNQQAMSYQMRYNLSELNNQNYQTLSTFSSHLTVIIGENLASSIFSFTFKSKCFKVSFLHS